MHLHGELITTEAIHETAGGGNAPALDYLLLSNSDYDMDSKFTAGGSGITPHVFPEHMDFSQVTEDELRTALVLRSRLSGEMPMQIHASQLRPEYSGLSRPAAAQLSAVGTNFLGQIAGREPPQPAVGPGPILLGPAPQFQTPPTFSVPPGLLIDNYKAISVLGSEPLKNRVLSPAVDVPSAAAAAVADHGVVTDPSDLQPPDSEEAIARTQKKREKNRIAQRRFRLRQKQLVADLQDRLNAKSTEIDELKKEKSTVQEENKALRAKLVQMGVDVDSVLQSTNNQEQVEPAAVVDKTEVESTESKE